MPGLSVLADRDAHDSTDVEDALSSAEFDDDYVVETLYDGESVFVAWSGYPAYPLTRLETDEWHLFVEGMLYDRPAANRGDELEKVASWLVTESDEELARWLSTCDGDFLLAAVHKETEQTHLLGDAFARLPTYRATVGGSDVVSRELGVVRALARRADGPLDVDRLAVAQTLLFGYRLGCRTLFDGVERLPPAARLKLGDDPAAVFQHDFGVKSYANHSIEENANRLARQFVRACANRTNGDRTVVSLSGGLDSRAVLGGYSVAGADPIAATFERTGGSTGDEVRIARTVAESLDVPWRSYRVSSPATAEARLLDAKQGMNSLGTAFVVDFLDQLVADVGRGVTLVTGDGGDKALPALAPPRSFADVDGLTEYLVEMNAVLDAPDAAAAAGVEEARLLDSVTERLASFPETSLADRYAHFYVRERGINWLNQGEDRNRYFCWSATPFYATPFFAEAMNCPTEQKEGSRLFRAFLRALDPALETIEYADFGAAPDSREYAVKRAVYERLSRHPRAKEAVLGFLRDDSADEEVCRRIRTLLSTDDAPGRALSTEAVGRLLDDDRVPAAGAYDLLTVARAAGAGGDAVGAR